MENKIADSKIALIIQVYMNEKYFVVDACAFDRSNSLYVCVCGSSQIILNRIEYYTHMRLFSGAL